MKHCVAAPDGRVERTVRTRRLIIAALRALILDGVVDPTALEVAGKVGITKRTLFRHFPDMESLHRALIEEAEAKAGQVMEEPFSEAAADQWPALLHVVIDRRVRVYESILPLYISIIWSRYRSNIRSATGHQTIRRRRRRLKQILPESVAENPLLFEALDGVLGIEYWVSLRRDQRLGVAKAAAVLRAACERLTSESQGEPNTGS